MAKTSQNLPVRAAQGLSSQMDALNQMRSALDPDLLRAASDRDQVHETDFAAIQKYVSIFASHLACARLTFVHEAPLEMGRLVLDLGPTLEVVKNLRHWTFISPSYNTATQELYELAGSKDFSHFESALNQFVAMTTTLSSEAPSNQKQTSIESDPLLGAKQRGLRLALDEWEKPENLSLQGAATYASLSDGTINGRRQRGELYALVAPNKSRGFRYPKWQFEVDHERLKLVLKAFDESGQRNSWVLHNFLTTPHVDLGDVRPCDYIADLSAEIGRLCELVQRTFALDGQGA